MADDAQHAAVVESLKATASELQARPSEEMNRDWADRMADGLAAAGLLATSTQPDRDVDDFAVDELASKLRRAYNGIDAVTEPWRHVARIALAQRIPVAPADDEATKNAVLKLADTIAFEAYRAWAASSNRDAYVDVAIRNAAKSAALAALREGQS